MSTGDFMRKAFKAAATAILDPTPTRWERLMQSRFELTARESVDVAAADSEQLRLVAMLSTYSGDRARIELREARERFADNPSAANQKAMEEAQMIYPQAVDSYRALRSQAKEACRKHGTTVLKPIADRIFARAVELIDSRLAELLAEESLVLERHALPYEPSPLSRALADFRDQLRAAATVFDSNPTATLRMVLGVLV
jgi:hypothetical protein